MGFRLCRGAEVLFRAQRHVSPDNTTYSVCRFRVPDASSSDAEPTSGITRPIATMYRYFSSMQGGEGRSRLNVEAAPPGDRVRPPGGLTRPLSPSPTPSRGLGSTPGDRWQKWRPSLSEWVRGPEGWGPTPGSAVGLGSWISVGGICVCRGAREM